ncbi:MAG: capsular biosynthesis protein [Flavobacteriales bacterium]|nr:capsular biosynthesis protein [Flavobacteriales bacterium]|tara:strand:+ start:5636 stop:6373 length:738 start_codon:yes stop_codon:yes gene_type:complete
MIKWFSAFRRKKLDPLDFTVLKTDMHSHLIPLIDDGSQSEEESIHIISELKNLGFSKIITTPHTMSDYYKNTPEIINKGKIQVSKELKRVNLEIEFDSASEYYVDYDFRQQIVKNSFLTFGSKYLLIEFPFVEEPKDIDDIIFQLQLSGYNVVLAHPERYLYYTNKDLKKFTEKGVLLQLNLLSITGYYSDQVRKNAEKLINEDLISFVGTDCHNINQAIKLKECFTNPLWHQLSKSEKLLNNTL